MKKKRLSFSKILVLIMLLSFLLTAILPLFAKAAGANENMSLSQKKDLLEDLTKRKDNLATKLKEARLKEAYASDKLRGINRKLRNAQSELKLNQKYLSMNQEAFDRTKKRLDELTNHQEDLEKESKERILAIYKLDRLKIIEGLVNANSATEYLDHIYYQKRVMQYDKQVLDALVDQSENIAKYKKRLSDESRKVANITSRLRTIEKDIAAQKYSQSKVLNKLRNERRVYEQTERQLERESVKLIYKISKLSGSSENPDATGNFVYPVKARITSPFGMRRHPIFGVRSMHSGIDLAAPRGTKIKASEGGLVIYSGWYGGYGRVVIIDHAKGYSTLYAHLDRINVKVGQRVKQGHVVGHEGATGYATGPHLHFEVRSKGKPQNPTHYLQDA